MTTLITFSDLYTSPLRAGVLWMIALGLLSGLALDMGEASGCFCFARVACWMLFGLILFRRPTRPTLTDLTLLKWAFPILYETGFLVYPCTMHLRALR